MPSELIFSSFAQAKKRKGQPLYSIALFSPQGVSGMRELPVFYPTEYMLAQSKAGAMPWAEYVERFYGLLLERHERVVAQLERLPERAVLCCWCSLKPTAADPAPHCHRQLVAAYLERNFAIRALVE
jgi:hypothetical protein